MFELVKVSLDDRIGTIQLDNPKKVNALSQELIGELMNGLVELQKSGALAVILRAGPGAKTFSAGHDVRELPLHGRDPLTYNDPLRQVVRAVERHPAPVIAMIEGGVWGGACELVMSCDMIIASEESRFAITPAKLGVPYNLSGVLNFFRMASPTMLKEMLFTAQPITALRANQLGIVNHVVPAAELEAFTRDMALAITKNSPLVITLLKEELRLLSQAHPLNPETFERVQSLRRKIYDSADYQEGIQSFLEKRAPQFQGK